MEKQWKGKVMCCCFHQSPCTEARSSSVWTLHCSGLGQKSSVCGLQILHFLRLGALAQKHCLLHFSCLSKKKTCKKGEQEQQQFCAVCSWWCISVKYLFSASSEHSAFYNGCRWTELCFLSKYTQSHLFMRICFKENSYWRKGSIWYSRRSRKRDQENLCRVPL